MQWMKQKLQWLAETVWHHYFNEPPRAPKALRRPERRKP
jgi:hypothetical protein